MNADQMIDYVLGRLEAADHERTDKMLQKDPGLSSRADALARNVQLLLDDGPSPEPPPRLADRTLSLVSQARSRPRTLIDLAPARVPFRWADVAVAASIFLAGVLTLIPAIKNSRQRMSLAGCTFNLQQLGHSLAQYATLHPSYPYPPSQKADAPAGTFAAFLHDAGVLHDLTVLDCPYNGPCNHPTSQLPSFDQIEQLRNTDPEKYRHLLCWDYAYNVGYRQRSGNPGPLESRPPMAVPVLADAPSHENYARILAGNSPNHGGRGQNVLYSDGSVHFHPTRRVSPIDRDLYLNNQNELKPGLDAQDYTLFPCYAPFNGAVVR